ncbi:unnamed protein product [Staurois parvus]|uniref:Uncharacterized protein n=1 Tax=Staurois parvus TaxID=386267 RepID=A0ABN9ATX8_9NEOB|nr:unnamed protein product [Staurois parvus]
MCHFQVAPHTSCWFPFCHRLLADYRPPIGACQAPNLPSAPVPPRHAVAGSTVWTWVAVWPPIAAASTATLWLQTLVFGPV